MDIREQDNVKRRVEGDAAVSATTQTRRAACDRCRGQKLRCLVDYDDPANAGKCNRCIAAGTSCSFGLSKRAGRPRAWNTKESAERKKKGKDHDAEGDTHRTKNDIAEDTGGELVSPLEENLDGSPMEICTLGQSNWHTDSSNEMDQINNGLTADASAFEMLQAHEHLEFCEISPSIASRGWADESFNVIDKIPPGIIDNLSPGNAWSFAPTSQSFGLPAREAYNSIDGTGSRDLMLTQSCDGQASSAQASFMRTYPSVSSELGVSGSILAGADNTIPRDIGVSSANDATEQRLDQRGGRDDMQPQAPSGSPKQRRVQALSELNVTLYSQVLAAETDLSRVPGLLNPDAHLASEILKSSSAFLSLLKNFAQQSSRSVKALTSETAGETGSDSEVSDFNPSNQESLATEDTRDVSSTGPIPLDESMPVAADMATTLQLLTCYIHIIHLHGILYSRILGRINNPRNSKGQPQLIFPGLQLGGVRLDMYWIFQVKFALQIITHVLGEIEAVLGLPEDYRVSKKSSKNRGILEASVSTPFVEMMMKENSRIGLELGPDGIGKIRENLRSLKKLVRGSINV